MTVWFSEVSSLCDHLACIPVRRFARVFIPSSFVSLSASSLPFSVAGARAAFETYRRELDFRGLLITSIIIALWNTN